MLQYVLLASVRRNFVNVDGRNDCREPRFSSFVEVSSGV